jgi:hypothetical protein
MFESDIRRSASLNISEQPLTSTIVENSIWAHDVDPQKRKEIAIIAPLAARRRSS